MKTRVVFCLLTCVAACGAAKAPTTKPAVANVAPAVQAQRVAASSGEDRWREWRSPPRKLRDDLPFWEVVQIDTHGMGNTTAPCTVRPIEGAVFASCGVDIARVDGARLDFSFGRSAPENVAGLSAPVGRFPDDVWFWADGDQKWAPMGETPDPFIDSVSRAVRYQKGKWTVYESNGLGRIPYGATGFIFPKMPAIDEPVDVSAPGCADFACARIIPQFRVTEGMRAPDFSALKDKIAWLHTRPSGDPFRSGGPPKDYEIVVDKAGPVFVVMRALEVQTKRQGWGVASWTPERGAAFDWLPSPFAAAKRESAPLAGVHAGRLWLYINDAKGPATFLELVDGKWSKEKVGKDFKLPPSPTESSAETPLVNVSEYIVQELRLSRRLPDGSTSQIDEDAQYYPWIYAPTRDDVWLSSMSGLYRTVKPAETLFRTELGGHVHSWPPSAEPDCTHPFVVFDATSERNAKKIRSQKPRQSEDEPKGRWDDLPVDLPLVEMHFDDQVIIGVVASSMKDAEEKSGRFMPPNANLATAHGIVCAHPVDARPFVRQ